MTAQLDRPSATPKQAPAQTGGRTANEQRLHITVIMGEGGHSKECLRLIELLGAEDFRYSYVLVADDEVTESKLQIPGPVFRVIRPRDKTFNLVTDLWKYPLSIVQAARAFLALRPDAVLTTGPSVAVPTCLVARMLGAEVLFVETGSRIHGLSATGRFMKRLAGLYFVQWQELLPAVPRGIFAGRLF